MTWWSLSVHKWTSSSRERPLAWGGEVDHDPGGDLAFAGENVEDLEVVDLQLADGGEELRDARRAGARLQGRHPWRWARLFPQEQSRAILSRMAAMSPRPNAL
jgi:hypothetical protein